MNNNLNAKHIKIFYNFVKGDDPQLTWVLGTTTVFMLVYWLNASWYTFMDITNRPKFMRKYKIQPGKNEPVDNKKLIEVSFFSFCFC